MPVELLSLLRRDHNDLERALVDLARPRGSQASRRHLGDTLDGVRLGLIAHSEAEEIILSHAVAALSEESPLPLFLARMRADHLEQERALSALIVSKPFTPTWRDRADQLRALIMEHGRDEEAQWQALRAALPPEKMTELAAKFATERMRQLAMIQPSAPIVSYAELAG